MPVHPQVSVMLEQLSAAGIPALSALPPVQARFAMAKMGEGRPPGAEVKIAVPAAVAALRINLGVR